MLKITSFLQNVFDECLIGILLKFEHFWVFGKCKGAFDLLMEKYTRELDVYLVLFELNEMRV